MIPSRLIAAGVGALAFLGWAAVTLGEPAAGLQGWLIGFVFVSGLSLGSLAIVLIHRLTAGRWGAAFAPELAPAAQLTPLLLLFVLPVLLGLGLIYPWAHTPLEVDEGVRRFYLNPPLFWVRTLVALGGWSAIALSLHRIEGPRGRLGAGLALAFHGLAVSLIGVDWMLSVKPSFTSSDFGMAFATEQLMAGFAFAALQARARAPDQPSGDIAGLLLATIIGLTYLVFMDYLVVWYGDRPPLDSWYVSRAGHGWRPLVWLSLLCVVASLVLLAARRAFGTHRAVAGAGALALVGLLSLQTWLLAPAFGAQVLLPEALALLAMGGVWLALFGGLPRFALRTGALAHGR
jgi:hypothetical protein